MLRELWGAEGVDHRGVRSDDAAPTGVYFVTHGAQRPRVPYFRGLGGGRMTPATLPLARCAARVLHVSAISQAISARACDAVFAAIDVRAPPAGASRSIPTCGSSCGRWPRARALIVATIGRCDWFLPSLDDLQRCPA